MTSHIKSQQQTRNTICCNCGTVINGPKKAESTSHGLCVPCVRVLYPEYADEFEI